MEEQHEDNEWRERRGSAGSRGRRHHRSGQSSTSTSSSLSLPTPPDGGYGWVVVMASFVANMILDGFGYSFGVIFIELLAYFGESKAKTAWVGSLYAATPLLTGPIASLLINRFGCRRMTIVGGLIASTGFILSSQATSLEVLYITYGFIVGLGLSFVQVASLIIVAFYFEKRLSFATGLSVSGAGTGTFLFSPLTEFLIERFSWQGALLIIGAIHLNIVVCGALFRPLVPTSVFREQQRRHLRRSSSESSCSSELPSKDDPTPTTPTKPQFKNVLSCDPQQSENISHSMVVFPTFYVREISNSETAVCSTGEDTPMSHPTTSGLSSSVQDQRITDKVESARSSKDFTKVKIKTRRTLEQGLESSKHRSLTTSTSPMFYRIRGRLGGLDRFCPAYRKDMLYRGTLNRVSRKTVVPVKSASCPDVFLTSPSTSNSGDDLSKSWTLPRVLRKFAVNLQGLADASSLHSPLFVYFCLHSLLLSSSYDIPYTYVPDKATTMGITETKAAYLLSIIGILSTVGQIIIGYLGDRPQVNTKYLYNILTMMAGILTCFVPALHTYKLLAVYSAAYGFCISANYALTTMILVDLVDMERLTNAYGLVSLSEGIANLFGPPLAGWVCDVTGSYSATFYIFGGIIMLSGLMLFAVPCLERYEPSRHDDSSDSSSSDDDDDDNIRPRQSITPAVRVVVTDELSVTREPADGLSSDETPDGSRGEADGLSRDASPRLSYDEKQPEVTCDTDSCTS